MEERNVKKRTVKIRYKTSGLGKMRRKMRKLDKAARDLGSTLKEVDALMDKISSRQLMQQGHGSESYQGVSVSLATHGTGEEVREWQSD